MNNFDTDSLADDVAVCLVFLMDGFNQAHGRMYGKKDNDDAYETHANLHSGYIGIVVDFVAYARFIENYLRTPRVQKNFPGVLHYEVTEDLGRWLFANPHASVPEFGGHAARVIDGWFADGDRAHAAHAAVVPVRSR